MTRTFDSMFNLSFRIKLILIFVCVLAIAFLLAANTGKTKYILLSFDVEPVDSQEQVIELLSILKSFNASSTFFVTGQYAMQYPDVVREISGQDHEVACHSYSHTNMRKLSSAEKYDEILSCSRILGLVLNKTPVGFRAPYLKIDSETIMLLKQLNFSYDASRVSGLGLPSFAGFASPQITEISISYFVIPLLDYVGLYYIHMPPGIYFWLLKHAGGEYLSLAFHPHHIIKEKDRLQNLLSYYIQKNNNQLNCENRTFITHQDFLILK